MVFCSPFLFYEARAQDDAFLCHSSASDANQMGFKWSQITSSFPQNAAGSAQIASPMRLGGIFNGSRSACLELPGSALGIRLVFLASEQMGFGRLSGGAHESPPKIDLETKILGAKNDPPKLIETKSKC